MFSFAPSPRVRPTPFFEETVKAGVKGFSVYNHMCMAVSYGNPAEEYWRLINGVSLWDVSVERQVQLMGPDAQRLAQILSCRDLSKHKVGQGKYVPICNRVGTLINDPIILKLADDLLWLSIADSDVKLMADGIAFAMGLNVEVSEPDVSPLALQGPKAEGVVARVFGDWVRDLRYFWFKETEIEGIPVVVQRSGWSKQGGFEIYLRDSRKASQLYNIMLEAGRQDDIGPGNPNNAERIESGLVSYGTDTDEWTNPYEVRLDKYVDLEIDAPVIGLEALRKIHAEGPRRHTLGVMFDGATKTQVDNASFYQFVRWIKARKDDQAVGHVTATAYSPRLEKLIGLALVDRATANIGDQIEITAPDGSKAVGELCDSPFI